MYIYLSDQNSHEVAGRNHNGKPAGYPYWKMMMIEYNTGCKTYTECLTDSGYGIHVTLSGVYNFKSDLSQKDVIGMLSGDEPLVLAKYFSISMMSKTKLCPFLTAIGFCTQTSDDH